MSHEPECESLQDTVVLPADCWICHLTKAAYRRGREDAANATQPDNTTTDCFHEWMQTVSQPRATCLLCGSVEPVDGFEAAVQRVRDLADRWSESRPELMLYATLAGHELNRALDGEQA